MRADGVVQEVTTSGKQIVSALVERVGAQRCGLWFGDQTSLSLTDGMLSVRVPNDFYREWLSANFRDELVACCRELTGQTPSVTFVVGAIADEDGEGSASTTASLRPTVEATPESVSRTGHSASTNSPREDQPATASPAAVSKRVDDGAPRRQFATFDEFLVGTTNRIAHSTALTVAEQPGSLTPLYYYGPTGVGKTHLLESIWSAVSAARPRTRSLFLSAEQFTSFFLEALHHSGLPSFRRKYRSVELLIIDDIHFFCGKQATAVELLHTIDTLLRNGRQVVLAGDAAPAELQALGPELTSRLAGGMVCPIQPADHSVRQGIVRQLADRHRLELPDDVVQMIAGRLTDHARQLSGAIHRLHAAARATGESVTLAMAERELADMTMHNGQVIQLAEIEKAVCDVFGLRPDSLRSDRKSRAVSQPRMLAMWLARKHTRRALSEIGDFFGRRSHTTVISAQKRVHHWMAEGSALGGVEPTWTAEEAIRRVEAKLRAS